MDVDREDFPGKLGPFSIASLKGTWSFSISSSRSAWKVSCSLLQRYGLRASDASLSGKVSPASTITLDTRARGVLKIPPGAKQFVWAYPTGDWVFVQEDDEAKNVDETARAAMQNFLSVGGFIYGDESGSVVGVTTPGPPDSDATGTMSFGKPKKWLRRWTRSLADSDRFQRITLKHLSQAGARHFCWIRPGEVLNGTDGQPLEMQPELPDGGFAYLFHDTLLSSKYEKVALDCYFPLKSVGLTVDEQFDAFDKSYAVDFRKWRK